MHCCELIDHARASWIVEGTSECLVSAQEKVEDIQESFVMAPRGIAAEWIEFVKDALAETVESYFAELAKELPVGFWYARRSSHSYRRLTRFMQLVRH